MRRLRERLAEAGWDSTYGARPLKRAIQRLLENPLALRLLEGKFAEGDTLLVDARDGRFNRRRVRPRPVLLRSSRGGTRSAP